MTTFELTDNHLKLLKNISWSQFNNLIVSYPEDPQEEEVLTTPFGGDNIYDQMELIINGKNEDFDPLTAEAPMVISDETKKYYDDIFSELPLALTIIFSTNKFEIGKYKLKRLSNQWIKI